MSEFNARYFNANAAHDELTPVENARKRLAYAESFRNDHYASKAMAEQRIKLPQASVERHAAVAGRWHAEAKAISEELGMAMADADPKLRLGIA